MKGRLSSQAMIILAVLAISCAANTEVQAGTITAREIVPGCGTLDSSTALTTLQKNFSQICSMDILFTVMNSDAMSQPAFTDIVLNGTQFTWLDFHMELGFGTGTQFSLAAPNCAVGFANTPAPTSNRFTAQGVGSNRIDWGDGTAPGGGGGATFNFTVNVQNLSACVPVGSQLANGYMFTLRQTPTVPEPATMLLLGTGLAGVAMKMRKRLKRGNRGKGAK